MEWIKLDTSFFSHPKSIQAGPQARMLAIAGWCWTAKHELDGLIPAYALPQLAFEVGLPIDAAQEAAKKLVQVGLWDSVLSDSGGDVEEAWLVHNFAKRQLTREAIERKREDARERQRRSREFREARRQAEIEALSKTTEGHENSGEFVVSHESVTRDSRVSHVAEERRGEEIEKRDIVANSESSLHFTQEGLTPLSRLSNSAEAPSDDIAPNGTPIPARNDPLRDERYALARELCQLVNQRYATFAESKPRAITAGQVRAMHGLLTSGPPGAKNDPVPESKIRRLVDMVFTDGVEPSPSGFCWAKNIRTAEALRRNWDSARVWANGVLDERAKVAPARKVNRGSSGFGDDPFDPPRVNG